MFSPEPLGAQEEGVPLGFDPIGELSEYPLRVLHKTHDDLHLKVQFCLRLCLNFTSMRTLEPSTPEEDIVSEIELERVHILL